MGWFGLTWQEKIAKAIYTNTYLKDRTLAKKMKDFLQPGGLNIRLVENMYREYSALMAQKYKPASFKDGMPDTNTSNLIQIIKNRINTDEILVLNFLKALQELSAAGTIPFAKWNPSGYAESTALQKSFDTEKSILDKAQRAAVSASKVGTVLLIVTGLGLASYLIYEGRRV